MRVLIVGAHPDDAEFYAGGIARKFTKAGHAVKFIAMTNGDAGHQTERGTELAERRRQESWAASNIADVEYQILNHHDGRLPVDDEVRDEMICLIRSYKPDLILTHRTNDYHPDHRHASILVQDAVYLLTVPSICPRAPHMRTMPMVCHMEDRFTKPLPFEADVVVSIDDTIEEKIAMLDCHVSQFYEWLPYNRGLENEVPLEPEDRIAWLGEQIRQRAAHTADRHRTVLTVLYGRSLGKKIKYAEAFEACEYGTPMTADNRGEIFPFF